MGTFIARDIWLARREGAALFGWGTTFSGPKASRVDSNSTYDRHHFVGWPAGWVVKKAVGCGGTYGNLYLEVKTTLKWGTYIYNATSGRAYWDSGTPNITAVDIPASIMNVNGPVVYDPVSFANGDGHVYESFDWYSNDMVGGTYAYGHADPTGTTFNGWYTGFQDGGLEPYLYNDADYEVYYGNFTTRITPSGMLDYLDSIGATTTTTTTSAYYAHLPTGSHWDRKDAVVMTSGYEAATVPYNYDGFDYLGDSAATRGCTFVMDENWTATGRLENITCKFRWRYNPESTEGCKYWEGKVVTVKVLYKKASVSKTDGPDGVFYTINGWASAGDSTQSLTLHGNYTDGYVADEVTMPSEEGYVYVIDDIEVLSVS